MPTRRQLFFRRLVRVPYAVVGPFDPVEDALVADFGGLLDLPSALRGSPDLQQCLDRGDASLAQQTCVSLAEALNRL